MTLVYITCRFTLKPKVSLTQTVAQLIKQRGSATLDELMPELEGYTRKQALSAMVNARVAGLIHCLGRAPRSGGAGSGSVPARHYPGPHPNASKPQRADRPIQVRPPNSAWELGHCLQIAGAWPPVMQGRRYGPLGSWDEEEVAA